MLIKFFNRFINLFIAVQDKQVDMDTRIKSMLINFYSIMLISIILVEAFSSLLLDKIELAVPFLVLSIFSILGHTYLRLNTSIFHQKLLLGIALISVSTLAITGGNMGMGILWSAFYPFVATALRGRRAGSMWSVTLFAVSGLGIFIFQYIKLPYKEYNYLELIFYSSFFVASYFTAYALQFMRSEVLLKKDRELIDSKNQNNAIENMLSRLSHQIRTPLSNIIGVADNFYTTSLSKDQKELTDLLKKSSDNLTEVVNDLVMATKTEAIQSSLNKTSFNLYNTLNSVFLLLLSENKNIKYSIYLSPDIPYQITGNSMKIKLILLNIINGIYSQKEDSSKCNIVLDVKRTSIMPNKVDLIFSVNSDFVFETNLNQYSDNFFNRDDLIKLNTGKVVKELNLELTQKMIEVEGYPLNITTCQTNTTFEFRIPYSTAKYDFLKYDESNKKTKSKILMNEPIDIKDSSILIVEDNISNQHILKLYIRNHVNKIDIANNGKEALDKIALSKYDLILMDIQMPILDGLKATQKIREIEQSTGTHIPIIAVTANAFPEDQAKCFAAGMDDYISKPFDPNLLITKIKENLNSEK